MQYDMENTIMRRKSRSIFTPILLFFLSLIGSAFIILIMIVALLAVILESKLESYTFSSGKIVREIESDYENGISYEETLEKLYAEEKRPMAVSILDDKDRLLASYGEELDKENANIVDLKNRKSINISLGDRNQYKKEANDINISLREIAYELAMKGNKIKSYDDALPFFESVIYSHDYWIGSRLSNQASVYIKCNIELLAKDFIELCIPAALLAIVFLISSIGKLISTIATIITQRYYVRLLLSDPVTGGNNAFAFETYSYKYITSVLNKKRGFAIIDLSLEKYQNYCTLYGIDEGERLLRVVERIISRNLKTNEIISRITNGNFWILMRTAKEDPDEKALIARFQALLNSINDKIVEYGEKNTPIPGVNNIRFKAGFYYLPPAIDEDSKKRRLKTELSIKNLCIKAEMAKNTCSDEKGMCVYNHEMWEKEIWEKKVEDMMQAALTNEEFQVYIQPKYDPSTEELKGGEALVRWISPTEGFISPGQFIPIFEKTGFVTKLDDYMILHTAKLQSEWLQAGKKIVPISVNVSRAHFAQPDLAEHIRDLVDTYSLPHEFLEIELTESAFFDDKNALLTTVNRLQEYGFEVSMDDFGSGYSSLNSLKDLPLDVLKLDAEFFRGEDTDGRGEIVVSKAISLAKQLNMRIVAEGVEKKEQVDFLASLNCDMIQGFYFAKPMPATEYESRMG